LEHGIHQPASPAPGASLLPPVAHAALLSHPDCNPAAAVVLLVSVA